MRTAPIIFALVISLLWHTFPMAQVGLAHSHGEDAAHIAMHLANEPHHHHDDGAFHQDDTDESLKHVYSDGCANSVGAIPTTMASATAALGGRVHFALAASDRDSPVLEGPRRPPRSTA